MPSVSLIDGHIDGCDTCIICGRDVPEGRQVCPNCECMFKKSESEVD